MAESVLAIRPDGKRGVSVIRKKYEQVRKAITQALTQNDGIGIMDFYPAVREQVGSFEGSLDWYIGIVKLDMEARGDIKHTADDKLFLIGSGRRNA